MKKNIFVSLFALFVIAQISLFTGKYPLSFHDYLTFWGKLFWQQEMDAEKFNTIAMILLDIRLVRIFSAMLIGASLSGAGAAYQAMFVNPLVSPSILGVLSGASFGAALAMVLKLSWYNVQLFTFFFGLLAVIFALGIYFMYRRNQIVILILGGVISTSLFSSLLSVLKFSADPNDVLPAIVYWLMGSLSFASKNTVIQTALPILIGIFLLLFFSKYFNALSLGDEEAIALGINTFRLKLTVIFLSTVISALSVVLAGVIGWVGLIIPHAVRFVVGADNDKVIPLSILWGASFLLLCDTLSRVMLSYEIPIGIITSLIGIPVFILILYRSKEEF